jgi:hypothetical protein
MGIPPENRAPSARVKPQNPIGSFPIFTRCSGCFFFRALVRLTFVEHQSASQVFL